MRMPKLNLKNRTKWVLLSVAAPFGAAAVMLFASSGIASAGAPICSLNYIWCLDSANLVGGTDVTAYVAPAGRNITLDDLGTKFTWNNIKYENYLLKFSDGTHCVGLYADYTAHVRDCSADYTVWSRCTLCGPNGSPGDKWINRKFTQDIHQLIVLSHDTSHNVKGQSVGQPGWFQLWYVNS